MFVIDPGHKYELHTLDGAVCSGEVLTFVKRIGDKFPGNEPPAYPGTTTQDVLRVLIDRAKYVNQQHPDQRNYFCIKKMRECIVLLEERAAAMHGCNFDLSKSEVDQIETYTPDKDSGHLKQFWI